MHDRGVKVPVKIAMRNARQVATPPKLDQNAGGGEREQHDFGNKLESRFGRWPVDNIAEDARGGDETDHRRNQAEAGQNPPRVQKRRQRERGERKKTPPPRPASR
jgi:hypothetical protein